MLVRRRVLLWAGLVSLACRPWALGSALELLHGEGSVAAKADLPRRVAIECLGSGRQIEGGRELRRFVGTSFGAPRRDLRLEELAVLSAAADASVLLGTLRVARPTAKAPAPSTAPLSPWTPRTASSSSSTRRATRPGWRRSPCHRNPRPSPTSASAPCALPPSPTSPPWRRPSGKCALPPPRRCSGNPNIPLRGCRSPQRV